MTRNSYDELLAAYEAAARENRPDWGAFLDEALDDPAALAYEVDAYAFDLDPHAVTNFDDVYDAVVVWLEARCHESLAGGPQ